MSPVRYATRGFTLVEVSVALVIGGLAVTGAAALITGLGGRAEAVRRAGYRADRHANAERVLRTLVQNLDLSVDSSPSLRGDSQRTTFTSWCETPHGWLDRCRIHLSFNLIGGVHSLRLQRGDAVDGATELFRGLRAGSFRYLSDPSHGGRWTDSWSNLPPPAAVAVIVDRDTLLLAVWTGG